MPVTSSGQIALIADIAAEFTDLGTSNVSMSAAATQAGLAAGEIQMTDFYGLSDAVPPSVIILTPSSNITTSGFQARGRVTSDGGGAVTSRGFYIGTSSTYSNNTQYTAGSGTGDFTYTISGLSSGTTYYITPFATNSAGTSVGSGTTTTTAQPSLSSHISFSLTSSSGTSWDVCSNCCYGGQKVANWTASGSYQGYIYIYGDRGTLTLSNAYFYNPSISGQSGSGNQWINITGNRGCYGEIFYDNRGDIGYGLGCGGYVGIGTSFAKSGYAGFGITVGQTNFSYSDVRLKTNIKLVGQSDSGLNIYTWNYIDAKYGIGTYKGVMAQEVPGYARTKDAEGFYMVDYSKLDVKFEKV